MSIVGDILPGNSDTFEKALAHAMSDELPVPYAQILDPYQTPVAWLPWLAAHYSVDLWFDDWAVATKREMIAQCAGLSETYPGEQLGDLKGTFEGLKRYLWFVGATVIDRVAYPARFVFNQSALGITPINHPAHKARYLVKVTLERPFNAFEIGRSAMGIAALREVDLEPIRRAKTALRVSKAPETEYVVSFARRRRATFGDGLTFDDELHFGGYIDRVRL